MTAASPAPAPTSTSALDDAAAPIVGVLCFLEAGWPLIGGSFTIEDIHVLWPRQLVKRIADAASQHVNVDSFPTRLATAFPPA